MWIPVQSSTITEPVQPAYEARGRHLLMVIVVEVDRAKATIDAFPNLRVPSLSRLWV